MHPGSDPNGWPVGNMMSPAAPIIIGYINANTSLLPGTTLQLREKDSSCQKGKGIVQSMDWINNNDIGIIGTGCSAVAMAIAPAMHYSNIPMVSYANSNPSLSDK